MSKEAELAREYREHAQPILEMDDVVYRQARENLENGTITLDNLRQGVIQLGSAIYLWRIRLIEHYSNERVGCSERILQLRPNDIMQCRTLLNCSIWRDFSERHQNEDDDTERLFHHERGLCRTMVQMLRLIDE